MGGVPNYSNTKARSRMKQAGYLERDKCESEWGKKLKVKYPDCVGQGLFDDCPEKLDDSKNVPSICRSCPQYIPPIEERKKKMQELMNMMKKEL